MKKLMMFFCALFFSLPLCYACDSHSPTGAKNIQIVKEMFGEFAEKLNINSLDTYYSKDFILESNGKTYTYQQYKDLETNIYKTLKRLKVVRYDDIFAAGDKVVSRMSIRLVHKDGRTNQFQVILIAQIKGDKISRIWEITYPSWSDKLAGTKISALINQKKL